MGMSISYGEPNDEESIATMHRAIDLGVNLIVTSDAYGNGVNEELVGESDQGHGATRSWSRPSSAISRSPGAAATAARRR